jgi:hypothetical protein
MYASPAVQDIFNIDPDDIVGKPVLLFIRADDLASFVSQIDMVKSTKANVYIRFWFQSPNLRYEVPCEAMIFGSSDGFGIVIRKCKPFFRRRFIESDLSSSSSRFSMGQSQFSYPSNATSELSSSSSKGTQDTLNHIPLSRLRNLKILDLEDNSRTWDEALGVDTNLAVEVNRLPEGYGIKEYRAQEYNDDVDVDDDDDDDSGTEGLY